MSGTLSARKRPKSKYPWNFKGTIRDRIKARYDGLLTSEAVPYLQGLLDMSDGDDAEYLDEMITALESGEEIEFEVNY